MKAEIRRQASEAGLPKSHRTILAAMIILMAGISAHAQIAPIAPQAPMAPTGPSAPGTPINPQARPAPRVPLRPQDSSIPQAQPAPQGPIGPQFAPGPPSPRTDNRPHRPPPAGIGGGGPLPGPGNNGHFRGHDGRDGTWFHGRHDGRQGWWWISGGSWYFSQATPYPRPYAYPPPGVIVVQPPPEIVQYESSPPQYWYYCESAQGYYPNVANCAEDWILVPIEPPQQN